MPAQSYDGELRVAIQAADTAARILRGEFYRPGGPRGAEGHAEADTAAETRILDILTGAFPGYGYIGEELGRMRPPGVGGHLWAVDPNDGTSAFLEGFRGSSVSIALLREGRPVLAVVHAYAPPIGERDVFWWAEGAGPVRRNGAAVERTWPSAISSSSTALLTQYADRNPEARAQAVAPLRFRAIPSIAYRLALAAVGEGDIAASLICPNVWDCAAGHALLIGAGANLFDVRGRAVTYSEEGEVDCETGIFGGARNVAEHLIQRALNRPSVKPAPSRRLFWPLRDHVVSDSALLSRAQGCLLGQIAGDSLGSLVEFETPQGIARKYPGGVRRLEDGGTWGTIAGQPTDDSELALALARALIDRGRYDEEEIARRYAEWFRSGPFDIGATLRAALAAAAEAVASGRPAAHAAREAANPASAANGALMRISPLGIFCAPAADPDDIAAWASADAALTHPNRICREANAIYAAAIAHAIRRRAGPAEVYARAMHTADRIGASGEVRSALETARSEPPRNYLTRQGWVLIAFQNAMYQALHAPALEEGIVDTVMRGGDTDTNGAIAGALLGAIHGAEAIPRQWVDRILTSRPIAGMPGVRQPRPADYWPADVLYLAERLLIAGGFGRA